VLFTLSCFYCNRNGVCRHTSISGPPVVDRAGGLAGQKNSNKSLTNSTWTVIMRPWYQVLCLELWCQGLFVYTQQSHKWWKGTERDDTWKAEVRIHCCTPGVVILHSLLGHELGIPMLKMRKLETQLSLWPKIPKEGAGPEFGPKPD
jgi:hypothetical protein